MKLNRLVSTSGMDPGWNTVKKESVDQMRAVSVA